MKLVLVAVSATLLPAVAGVARRTAARLAALLLTPDQYSPANRTLLPLPSVRVAELELVVRGSVSVSTACMYTPLLVAVPPDRAVLQAVICAAVAGATVRQWKFTFPIRTMSPFVAVFA
ncbi:hypothetical protein ACFQDE_03750 [Deinococcus caeni]|uniref:hypothetical protein n=1 Tax=Deinococcus caeni TaxID=569127 RepID=UPI00360B9799